MTRYAYAIGTTAGNQVNVETLNINPPKGRFYDFDQYVPSSDNRAVGLGAPGAIWEFDVLTQDMISALRGYCPGASSDVYITTRKPDGIFESYRAIMTWPRQQMDRRNFNGRHLGVEIAFRNPQPLQEATLPPILANKSGITNESPPGAWFDTIYGCAFYYGGDSLGHGIAHFPAVNIPVNALVTQATLSLVSIGGGGQAATLRADIHGDLNPTPSFPTSYAAFHAINRSTTSIYWQDTTAESPTPFTTPDFATVLQETVNVSGWASGNAMQVLFIARAGSNFEQYFNQASVSLNVTYKA